MSTQFTIDEYCKNPANYNNVLSKTTIDYYSKICSARKSLSSAGGSDDWKKTLKNVGKATGTGIEEFVISFLSPESLGIVAAAVGVKVVLGKTFEKAVKSLISGGFEDGAATGVELIADGVDAAAANSSTLLSAFLSELVIEDAGDLGLYALGTVLKGAELFAEGIEGLLDAIAIPLMVLQLLSGILDGWDPCDLETNLSADSLVTFNTAFNTQFRQGMITAIGGYTDAYGNTVYSNIWPIEFYADSSILVNKKKTYYKKRLQIYLTNYINGLGVNSLGQVISWQGGGRAITTGDLNNAHASILAYIADQNTVVTNFYTRYWPLLLFLGILFILFILFIIKNIR